VNVKENGGDSLEAKIGLWDFVKLSGIVIGSITVSILMLRFFGLDPDSARLLEHRLTGIEHSVSSIAGDVRKLTNDLQQRSMELSAEHAGFEKRILIIEQTRFTVQDGIRLQKDLAELRESLSNLPPDAWRQRIEYMEKFLTRHYPQEFQR